MPTDKKRINLTISEELYERIKAYKDKNGIATDASACIQLIIQRLDGLEQTDALVRLMKSMPMEQLLTISKEGFSTVKSLPDPEETEKG